MGGWSLTDWKAIIEIVLAVATLGLSALMLKMRASFVSKRDFDAHVTSVHEALEARLDAGDKQFSVIENELKHLPSINDIREVLDRLASVDRAVAIVGEGQKGLDTAIKSLGAQMAMLQEIHMKRG